MRAVAVAPPTGTISLFPRQTDFVLDETKWLLATGGIGSGKSTTAMAKVVSRVARRQLGMVVAPTYKMLQDATLRTLFALLDQAGVPYTYNKGDHLITIPITGHEIIARSAEDPDNLRGPDLDYVAVDELAYVRDAAFRVLRGRVRRPNTQLWAATTPRGRNFVWDWWVRLAVDDDGQPLSNRRMYRFRTDENPELDPAFISDLGFTGQYAAQELGGEFVAFEGIVYAAFDRETMVRPTEQVDVAGWDCVIGGDVGARHPTAIITVRFAGDGRSHIEREYYVRNLSASDITSAYIAEYRAAITRGVRPDSIQIDPSAAGYIADLKRAGLPVVKADNDRLRGVQLCQATIANGLTVNPSCVNFISEIESYHYPDGEGTKDDPVKEHDDAMDAWRYAVVGRSAPKRMLRAW